MSRGRTLGAGCETAGLSRTRQAAGATPGRRKKLEIYERSQEVVENKGPRFRKAKRSMKTKELSV
jgi:hypothetical protein